MTVEELTRSAPETPVTDERSRPALDIKDALQKSTSQVAVSDLQKKGFKQVKVLNKEMIAKFIHEAVDRVIASRAEEISKEERKRIVEETHSRIEDLTRQRSQVENTLLEQIESYKRRIAQLEAETVKEKGREVEELNRALSDRDRQIEDLSQKLKEASSHRGSAVNEELLVALLNKFSEQAHAKPDQDLSQLQASIEGLAERISRLGSVAGGNAGAEIVDKEVIIERLFAQDTGESMESNVADVKVKQAKSRGVKNTLSKLKALQQGGTKDGE